MTKNKYIANKLPKILFVLLVCGIFATYTYNDIVTTQMHGIEFWNALSKGELLNYYSFCIENTDVPPVYDFTIYLIFAIWNFPCWVYEKLTGLNALDKGLWIMYGKILVLLAYFLTVRLFDRIYKKVVAVINEHEQNILSAPIATFFYASSLLLLTYSVFTGNYDDLELVFILAGFIALLDGQDKKFILFFSIACSMKYFAIWLFIPLLLLKEKRIVRIVVCTILCFGVSIIEKMIFHTDIVLSANKFGSGFTAENLISNVTHAGALGNFGIGTVSLCLTLYVILCIYCFMQKKGNDYYFVKKLIYVSTVAWGIFFLIVGYNCYWIVLMVPFLAMLVLTNNKNLFMNILLEWIFSFSIYINSQIRQWWVVGSEGGRTTHALLNSVLMKVFGLQLTSVHTIGDLINAYNALYGFDVFVNSIIIATFLILVIINYPGAKVQKLLPSVAEPNCGINRVINYRNAFQLAIFVLPTIYYLYQIIMFNILG